LWTAAVPLKHLQWQLIINRSATFEAKQKMAPTSLMFLAAALGSASAYLHACAPVGSTRFAGNRVAHAAPTARRQTSARLTIEAKKGRKAPITQRGNQVQQEKMASQYAQMKPDAGGFPLFNLFVRTELNNFWYPCGTIKGDDRAKQLCDGWVANSLGMGGMVKSNIDKSVAGSIFASEENTKKLIGQIVRNYPSLKDVKDELTFGYQIEYAALTEKQKITELTPDMKDGPLDGLRKMFGGN